MIKNVGTVLFYCKCEGCRREGISDLAQLEFLVCF